MKDIKGTFLKAEDGLEAIKNSIESVQKNGVFDEIVSVQTQVIVEPVKDDIPVEDKSDKDDEIVRQDTTDLIRGRQLQSQGISHTKYTEQSILIIRAI